MPSIFKYNQLSHQISPTNVQDGWPAFIYLCTVLALLLNIFLNIKDT